MPDDYEVAVITIRKTISEDDVLVAVETVPDDLPVVDALGLLRLAEDSILHPPADEE